MKGFEAKARARAVQILYAWEVGGGGQVPIVMSVAKDTPRRIVKIELVGAPFLFELVK